LDRISSAELVSQLVAIEGQPWAELKGGKEITQNGLARLLDRFGIRPVNIRLPGGQVAKGYYRSSFEDLFSRYLPPQTATPLQVNNDVPFRNFQTATSGGLVAVPNARKPSNDGHCSVVAVEAPALLEKEGQAARCCTHCNQPGNLLECHYGTASPWLHRDCIDAWSALYVGDIPPFLDRRGELQRAAKGAAT
jgi:hypothetical protein